MNRINFKDLTFAFVVFLGSTGFAQTLKEIAADKGVYIGTIMNNQMVSNTNTDGGKPNNIIRGEFNAIVLENAMKMNAVLPNRPSNPFSFGAEALNKGAIDKFLNYAKEDVPSQKLRTRGHTLIWYSQAPSWLENEADNWTSTQVYNFTYQYIKALTSYCGNRIDEWDVINEVLHDNNGSQVGPFRGNVWYSKASNNQSGLDDYFKFCFETAREFAPNAKLYYNDYSIERFNNGGSSKNARMRSFVTRLKNADTEIDGVGFQSHFTLSEMTNGDNIDNGFINGVKSTMEFIDNLGLDVAITELDIRRCGSGSDAAHKVAYGDFTKMALSQPNCNMLLIWGISDKDSWTIPWFGCDYSLIYNNSFNRKSAYFGVRDALNSLLNIGEFANQITQVTAPATVTQGETITVSVDYSSSGEHDLVMMLQLDEAPYTVFQEKRVKVFKEQAIADIELIVSFDVPVASNAYQFQLYLAPVNGGWDDRLSDLNKNNVSVIAGEREAKEPYAGVIQIPGTVEAENYDKGGQGVSYNDTEPENNGASGSNFRVTDGVDVAGSAGDYSVGWTADGEWLEYTVNITESAMYEVEFFYTSLPGGGQIGISQDGTPVLTGADVASTGDWGTVGSFKQTVSLDAGESLLRLNIEKGGFNLDKAVFTKKTPTSVSGENPLNSIQVFPNPSDNGVFFLSAETEYQVSSLDGANLFSGNGNSINMISYPRGVYLLSTSNETIRIMR